MPDDGFNIDILISWKAPDWHVGGEIVHPLYYGLKITLNDGSFTIVNQYSSAIHGCQYIMTISTGVGGHIEIWALSDFNNPTRIVSKDFPAF